MESGPEALLIFKIESTSSTSHLEIDGKGKLLTELYHSFHLGKDL